LKDVHQKSSDVPTWVTDTSVTSMRLLVDAASPRSETGSRPPGRHSSIATMSLALSVGATGLIIAEPHPVQAAEATLENSQTYRLFSQGETFMIPAPVTLATAPEAQPVVESSQLVAVASPSSASRVEPELPSIKHVVDADETFWSIAQRYGVSAEAIAKLNNLSLDQPLMLGQSIKIPAQFEQPLAVAKKEIDLSSAPVEVAALHPNSGMVAEAKSNLKFQEDEAIATLRAKQESLAEDIEQLREQTTAVVFDAEDARSEKPATLISSAALDTKTEATPSQANSVIIPVPAPRQAGVNNQSAAAEVSPLLANSSLSSTNRLPEPPSLRLPTVETTKPNVQPQESANSVALSIPVPQVHSPQASTGITLEQKPEEAVVAPQSPLVASAPAMKTHTVRSGETLYAIARRYGVPGRELIAANRLDNPNVLNVNQQLVIPKKLGEQQTSSSFVALLPSTEVVQGVNRDSETLANAPTVAVEPTRNEQGDEFVLSFDVTTESAVAKLRTDIARMRQDYQEQRAVDSPKTPVVEFTLNRDTAVNPEWQGKSSSSVAEVATPATATAVKLPESADVPQQLAAASQEDITSYNSLLRLSVGESVSPSLPPLANPDEYLPGDEAFKGYIWPAKGVLTSGYGQRWGRMHRGIDIAAPVGTPIFAAAGGEVISAGWNSGGYGNLVKIQHSDNSVTYYAHNSRILVRPGQQVKQGQQIAAMGSTGFSTGPHLHFEVHKNGQGASNPIAYLPSR